MSVNPLKFSRYGIIAVTLGISVMAAPAPPSKETRGSDRKSVELTVYNNNLALVREERIIPIPKGGSKVVVPDIPATIDPTSVAFSSLTSPGAVKVLEQNYQYDLVNQSKLLEKYIGKQVEFLRADPEKKTETSVTGKLLAVGNEGQGYGMGTAPNSGLIAEIGGKVEVNPSGRLVLPSLPEGLVLKPQLEWRVHSTAKDGDHRAEISYLAGSLSWSCDYVVLLNKEDNKIDLKGWVTLVNQSGATFKDAGLKLVAGDVNQVREEASYEDAMPKRAMMAAAAPPEFTQKELFEYKLYTLGRRTDLGNAESKQIELVSAKDVDARKLLIYDGLEDGWRYWLHNPNYRGQGTFGQQSNTKVGAYVVFKNETKSGLGLPLPKGKARVYKRDEDGHEQFIGEDKLDHTPKDEEIRLYLGNAFDVVGARSQTDFKSLASGHVVEETYQIKVRNHKKEAVEVAVYEHPWRASQWEITKSTVPGEKVDQTTLRFHLKIPTDGEKSLNYTIRYTW